MIKNKKWSVWRWTKTVAARKFFSLCRWLHVYLSTTIFSLLLFFSLTGFTLNHTDWFKSEGRQGQETSVLPASIQQALLSQDTPPLKQMTNFIEARYGLANPRSIDMDLELGEIGLDYPLPAGYAFVTVFVDSGELDLEYQTGPVISLLNDLHKGRFTGAAWSLLIDISSWSITLFSIAGFIILLQHNKRRISGLITVFVGTLSPLLIYWLWVPGYH